MYSLCSSRGPWGFHASGDAVRSGVSPLTWAVPCPRSWRYCPTHTQSSDPVIASNRTMVTIKLEKGATPRRTTRASTRASSPLPPPPPPPPPTPPTEAPRPEHTAVGGDDAPSPPPSPIRRRRARPARGTPARKKAPATSPPPQRAPPKTPQVPRARAKAAETQVRAKTARAARADLNRLRFISDVSMDCGLSSDDEEPAAFVCFFQTTVWDARLCAVVDAAEAADDKRRLAKSATSPPDLIDLTHSTPEAKYIVIE